MVSVPFFTGAIGYVTNWTGVWMLFEPVKFAGVKVPGLSKIVRRHAAQDPADPRDHERRPRLAGHHPLARGEDGLDRGRQGDRQGRQREGLLRADRARADRRADARVAPAATCARRSSGSCSATTPTSGTTCRRRCASGCTRASRSSCRTSSTTVTDEIGAQHGPPARREAHGDPQDGGGPGAVEQGVPRDRPQGAAADHQPRLRLRLRLRDPDRGHHRDPVPRTGGCCRCSASSSAGSRTTSRSG